MPVWLVGLFGTLGQIVTGLFNFKGEQAATVQSSLKLLGEINNSDAQAAVAASQAISAILTNGSFLERNWRPVLMLVCMVIIICSFFGYLPPHLNDALTPTMEKIWTMLEIGLVGYLPLRTLEKVIREFNIASIVKTLINKKVM